jgi:hypothetical protein
MSGQPVRTWVRAAFALCGICLIAAAILIALRHGGDSISLAALLAGVLLIVIGGTGRLPEEIGLQRVSFDPRTDASAYHRALVDVVQHEFPALWDMAAKDGRLVIRKYWLDGLDVPIVIICAPYDLYEVDQASLESSLQQAGAATEIIVLTNMEDIQPVQSVIRSHHGDRATVVRWRSHHDNEALRRAAHRLSQLIARRRKRTARNR